MKTCPDPSCPPGFTIKEHKSKNSRAKLSAMFQQSVKTKSSNKNIKSAYKKSSYNVVSALPVPKKLEDKPEEECIEFICLPEKPKSGSEDPVRVVNCPDPECPKGYDILLDNDLNLVGKCAKYTCEPIPQSDSVCNVTGRTFNTFDGTEFKYDICNHVLVRDLTADKWSIISMYLS